MVVKQKEIPDTVNYCC